MKKIDFSKIRGNLKNKEVSKKEMLEAIKQIRIKVQELRLRANLGTEDVVFTAYIITIISSIIGITLPHLASKNITNCNYQVKPIYKDRNEYEVSLNSIFSIKIVHIIYSMFILVKKGSNENNERASNRRSYAYRYE